jgi:phosphate transport system substrate-binding protein
MRTIRPSFVATFVLALPLVVGCGGCSKSGTPRVSAGGATFPDPIMQKWAGEYKNAKGIEIDYVAKGSGYGISNVTSKNLDFGCSDAPMNAKELEAAKAAGGDVIHVPVAIGAVAIIYNLPEVKEPLVLNGEVLARIYLREITKWDDPAIKTLNPTAPLPTKDIVPVYRAESSGTTNIFTEYLSKQEKTKTTFMEKIGVSKSPKWPAGGIGKEGNDGIAGHVKDNAGCIGYVELAYAKKNGIAYATLRNKRDKPIAPDAAAVTAAVDAATRVKPTQEPYSLHELTYSFTDSDADGAYPIVGASYAILFVKQTKDKGPVIVEFLKWVLSDGQKFATELDYAPLPDELAKKGQALLGKVTFE